MPPMTSATSRLAERISRITRRTRQWLEATSDRTRIVMLVGVAFALRLAWVLMLRRDGFAFNDAWIYHETAKAVSEGRGFDPPYGGPSAGWPPGFTAVLAVIYKVVGVRPQAGEVFNAFLGAVTVGVLFVAVRKAFDRTTATLAAAILVILPGPILWTDLLVAETLYTFVFVCFIAVMVHVTPSWRAAALVGAILGLAALVRGEALTWGLVVIVLWRRELPWRALARRIVVVGAAGAVVLAPWTIRNYVQLDSFVPVASNASKTLWVGHNPDATGAQMYPTEEYYSQFVGPQPERELNESATMRRDAIDFIVHNPGRELQLIPLKLLALNRGDSYALVWLNQADTPPMSAITVERIAIVADFSYFVILGLTLLGAVRLGRRVWRNPLMTMIATSLLTMCFLYGWMYYGNYRYRLPYEPTMVIVAAVVLRAVWTALGPATPQIDSGSPA